MFQEEKEARKRNKLDNTKIIELVDTKVELNGREILYNTVSEIFNERDKLAPNTVLKGGEKYIWEDYQEWKETEFMYFKNDIQELDPNSIWTRYPGMVGEALFLLACRESNIPIAISSGKQDLEGFDFYIFGYPIDVTTGFSPHVLKKKICPHRVATLFLPKYMGQKNISLVQISDINKPYTYNLIQQGIFPLKEYMEDLIDINRDIEHMMDRRFYENYESTIPAKLGLNNLQNLKTILELISGNTK